MLLLSRLFPSWTASSPEWRSACRHQMSLWSTLLWGELVRSDSVTDVSVVELTMNWVMSYSDFWHQWCLHGRSYCKVSVVRYWHLICRPLLWGEYKVLTCSCDLPNRMRLRSGTRDSQWRLWLPSKGCKENSFGFGSALWKASWIRTQDVKKQQ